MKIGVYLTCQRRFFEALGKDPDLGIEVVSAENYILFQNNAPFPNAWKDVDAFLYQPIIKPPSDYYRDENLLENFVSPHAVQIRLPYVMYNGIFPWYDAEPAPELKTKYGIGWIENDVEAYVSGTKTAEDILQREDTGCRECHRSSLAKLRQKELESDISGVVDFIEENLTTLSLFWTPNHPRGHLAYVFCAEVFRLLGLPALSRDWISRLDAVLAPERSPILPCVRRDLGIIRENDLAFFEGERVPVTPTQYVERYIAVHKAMAGKSAA